MKTSNLVGTHRNEFINESKNYKTCGESGYLNCVIAKDATRKLESHILIVSRLKKSRKVISEKQEKEESQDDLLGLLLGDNEDDEYDDVEVPSMISLE